MRRSDPFIPRDKPKSWVLTVLSGLLGLAIGLLAFAADWAELNVLSALLKALFVLCWIAGAVSWCGFALGMLSGKYKAMQARSWKEQIW
jgi:uncharacterized membrane protein HdeD (DUF308 family)